MGFFRYDSSFWSVTGRIFDLGFLNLLWFVTSLPIVTIGASTTALYAVAFRLTENENVSVFKSFFEAFRKNWKSTTAIWLICFALLGWLSFGVYVCSDLADPVLRLAGIPEASALILALLSFLYVFPICAVYQLGVFATLKRAFYLALRNLPWTLLLLLVPAIPVTLTLYVSKLLPYMISLWVFLGIGGIAYVQSFLFKRIFQ